MKTKHTIFFLAFLTHIQLIAQVTGCGTGSNKHDLRMLNQYNTRSFLKRRVSSIKYFPVKHHIIRRNNGTGGLSISEVPNLIEELNNAYYAANIQFYSCGIDYIDSDAFYDLVGETDEGLLISNHNDSHSINIYYANSVITETGKDPSCGYAYYPVDSKNFIAIANSCATNHSTVIHEVGHFFGLAHTHDEERGKELVDRRGNCSTAGDTFCDTPADPRLSRLNVNSNCIYTGTGTDVDGNAYRPDTRNFMSYSHASCRSSFTSEQLNRMRFWSITFYRSPLTNMTSLYSNRTITTNSRIFDRLVRFSNVTIQNNSNVTIDACQFRVEGGFEVQAGSTFEVR